MNTPLLEAIEQLGSGQAFFRDLGEETQGAFLEQVRSELFFNPHKPLSGEATQALILSTQGLIRAGVRRVMRPNLIREDIYSPEDAFQDTIVTMGSGWLTIIDPAISFGAFFRQRAQSTTSRKYDSDGMHGLHYPTNINIHNIRKVIEGIVAERNLAQPDSEVFVEAVEKSGTGKQLISNALEIGRAVYRFSFINELPCSTPTDEQEWENRLLIDADLDDDEWLATDDATDNQESSRIDDMIENISEDKDVNELVKSLPWDVVSCLEKDIINYRFGFEEEKPHTLEETGENFRLTSERIRQILDETLSALLDPTDRREQAKAREEFPILIERYLSLTNITVSNLAELLEIYPRTLTNWRNGKRNIGTNFMGKYSLLKTRVDELNDRQL